MGLNISERLVSARKIAGFSLEELSSKLDRKITRQALNKYEKGSARPSNEMLMQIARVLNVPLDYFYREASVKLDKIEFRKQRKLLRKDVEKVKRQCIDFFERYLELEGLLNIFNHFKNPLKDPVIHEESDIELRALELREAWNLGIDPIPGVLELLEEKRIKIYEIPSDEAFVGMSAWADEIPIIVLNKNMNSQRKRLTALHELAHLILDLSAFNERTQERLCFDFASAFLLPKISFVEWFGHHRSNMSLSELKMIDEHYGISVQAIMKRALNLGLITDPVYRNFNRWLSKTGNRKTEFGNCCVNESPQRFKRLLYKATSEAFISMSKAAALDNKILADFREEINAIG